METDILGSPYECETLDLGRDDEGPVVATLVRRRADAPTRRAVLYVHGFVDYFFQTHLAEFHRRNGWDFYALDLRKYGRSLLPHQTPNFCRDLCDYYPDLDEAVRLVRERDGHDTLLVNGHSTGGLIASMWAHDHRAAGLVDGLFLNSPFFDFNAPWVVRRPVAAAVANIGRGWPYRVVPLALPQVYGQSIHLEQRGEWAYDLAWKPLAGFPVRAGWLAAIRRAQRSLRAGWDIRVPVLLTCSTASYRGSRWHDVAAAADAVLDVSHMVRWAPRLGRHVTMVRIASGLHDLTLSPAPVREELFAEVDRWIRGYLAESGAPGDEASTSAAAAPAESG